MRSRVIIIGLSLILAALPVSAFSATPTQKPDYSGHFGDMDTNQDEGVDWKEFKAYFAHAEPQMFKKADGNQDQKIDHDEWHEFKESSGYGHKEENKHEKRK